MTQLAAQDKAADGLSLLDGALWLEQHAGPLLERLRVPGASLWFAARAR